MREDGEPCGVLLCVGLPDTIAGVTSGEQEDREMKGKTGER